MADATESRALRALREIIESGRPLLYVRSAEERRVTALLREAAAKCFAKPVPLFTWSLTDGMRRDGEAAGKALAPRAALDFVAAHEGSAIFLLKDFHEAMRESPEIRRRLRDLYEACADRGKFVVIASPVKLIPDEVERAMVFVELVVPDHAELELFLRREVEAAKKTGGSTDPGDATIAQLARALQGLTLDDAHHAVRRALSARKKLDAECIPLLLEEKRLLVNRAGLIEYIPTESGLEHVGGLETMKQWLLQRRRLFQMRDSISAS